jgi:transcriptional regulator with XRE-family HTH domain
MNNYEETIKLIAQNIKRIRIAKGLSVQEVAYRCDIERSNLSRLEAGRTNMTIKTLCLICSALNVEIVDLLSKKSRL